MTYGSIVVYLTQMRLSNYFDSTKESGQDLLLILVNNYIFGEEINFRSDTKIGV